MTKEYCGINGQKCRTRKVAMAQPFRRRRLTNVDEEQQRCHGELVDTMESLNQISANQLIKKLLDVNESLFETDDSLLKGINDVFATRWKLKDEMSEVAFRGMLIILEHCLGCNLKNHALFQYFVESLGFHTVFFWKKAVPEIYDSDMLYGTHYRDALLFALVLYDVNVGKNRLRELFAAVPGLRDSLLGKPAKRFREVFHHLVMRRTLSSGSLTGCTSSLNGGTSGRGSEMSSTDELDHLVEAFDEEEEDEEGVREGEEPHEDDDIESVESPAPITQGDRQSMYAKRRSMSRSLTVRSKHSSESPSEGIVAFNNDEGIDSTATSVISGGLSQCHFTERVINVSNAPPVSLKKRKESGEWEIGQGSGGLVTCCGPLMQTDRSNVWTCSFGPNVPLGEQSSDQNSPIPKAATNSLGIAILNKPTTEVHANILTDAHVGDTTCPSHTEIAGLMTLLKGYSKENFKLDPVMVTEDDYNTYYGGISNGLLWPALHNLSEYIMKDYESCDVMEEHWLAYIRVNYQFALNAVRNSRPQDFLWIHDYHLMLAGMIIQSLDPHLEVGFFLHIPFQPPDNFFTKYNQIGLAILRGLLRFTKVGFQTHRDRATFLEKVGEHLCNAKVQYENKIDKYKISHEGWTSSIGVFPVSVKNEDYLIHAYDEEIKMEAQSIRERIIGDRTGKFFLSVERFDYTKGIKEKLIAYRRYFEKYPDRIGKDVFLQIAVINRRSVETYAHYQDECTELAASINKSIRSSEDPEWRPLIFQTEGIQRPLLVAHYLAADVGVVTPRKDGMNLVAKEILICNPSASLIISVGAGTEQQLYGAGFYSEDGDKCYHRIEDVYSTEVFADVFHNAAVESRETAAKHGKKLNEFLLANDIEKWSSAFLDPSWTHEVIQPANLETHADFFTLMMSTRNVRRQITERVLKGIPIRPHLSISLLNAKQSLEKAIKHPKESNTITLRTNACTGKEVMFDVTDELDGLDKDIAFLEFIQSDEFDNVEQFLSELARYHPESQDAYHREIDEVITLIVRGDHFHYFFTDRDGTLKSYACSYASSIQPSYSGVIQATFAHRCSQYAAIVTSAPLLNIGVLDVSVMPDGYFSYGASGGREWYVDASKKFKDQSLNDSELTLLESVANDIEILMTQPMFQQFQWIGSGLQRHYGRITVAKQDCYGSVDKEESRHWSEVISSLVLRHDRSNDLLDFSESETDVKIHVKSSHSGRIFNKGHGIRLFAEQMDLKLSEGNILVCGDSDSDLPMLEQALKINPDNTYTIWVTRSDELRTNVTEACKAVGNRNYVFVSCPEVILGGMAAATIREIRIRPIQERDSTDMLSD